MDGLIESVPGMEGFLRRRDLPGFYRVDDVNDPTLKEVVAATRLIERAQAVIFNTCEDLEGQIVAEIHKHVPRVFSIGPIHEQVKYTLTEKKVESPQSSRPAYGRKTGAASIGWTRSCLNPSSM